MVGPIRSKLWKTSKEVYSFLGHDEEIDEEEIPNCEQKLYNQYPNCQQRIRKIADYVEEFPWLGARNQLA